MFMSLTTVNIEHLREAKMHYLAKGFKNMREYLNHLIDEDLKGAVQ